MLTLLAVFLSTIFLRLVFIKFNSSGHAVEISYRNFRARSMKHALETTVRHRKRLTSAMSEKAENGLLPRQLEASRFNKCLLLLQCGKVGTTSWGIRVLQGITGADRATASGCCLIAPLLYTEDSRWCYYY